MKKILAICLMMAMVVSMSVTVFAAPGGFVNSPSGNPAPKLVDFKPGNEACTAELVITPYAERAELTDALRTMLEKAYDEVAKSTDLTTLNTDFAKLVADKNLDGNKIAVSDLFDIHVTGCDYHDEHVDFDVTLDADTLNRFVGLLHMNKNGEWELVSDAEVTNNGEYLKFSVDSFSPFAIVVETETDAPQTGDNSMIHIYVIIMAVSALAILVIAAKSRKHKA